MSEEAKVWGLIMDGTVGCPRVNSATRYKKMSWLSVSLYTKEISKVKDTCT